jgi:hypothetical protein
MASRRASRTVVDTISVPSGIPDRRQRSGRGCLRRTGAEAADRPPCSALRRRPELGAGSLRGGPQTRRWRWRRYPSPSASSTAIGIDLDVLGAFGDQDLAEGSLVDGFHFHGRLVGLDFGDHVAGGNAVALGFFSHLASLPSSMVGESAGIKISIGM